MKVICAVATNVDGYLQPSTCRSTIEGVEEDMPKFFDWEAQKRQGARVEQVVMISQREFVKIENDREEALSILKTLADGTLSEAFVDPKAESRLMNRIHALLSETD